MSLRQRASRPNTEDLLDSAASGRPTAIGRVVERWDPLLIAEVRRHLGPARFARDGEDVLQEIRMTVARSLPDLRSRGRAGVATWLRRLVRTRVLDWEKARRARRRIPSGELLRVNATGAPELEGATQTPSQIVLAKEEVARLEAAIHRARPQYRELLFFLFFEAPTRAEIAGFLGKDLEAARKFAERAVRELRRILVGDMLPAAGSYGETNESPPGEGRPE